MVRLTFEWEAIFFFESQMLEYFLISSVVDDLYVFVKVFALLLNAVIVQFFE